MIKPPISKGFFYRFAIYFGKKYIWGSKKGIQTYNTANLIVLMDANSPDISRGKAKNRLDMTSILGTLGVRRRL